MSDPSELDQTNSKFQQQSLDADPLSPPSTPIIHICIRSTLQVICWFIVLELQTNGIIFPSRSSWRIQRWFPGIVGLLDWHFCLIWTLWDFSLQPLLLISSSARTQELAGAQAPVLGSTFPCSVLDLWLLCLGIRMWQWKVAVEGANSTFHVIPPISIFAVCQMGTCVFIPPRPPML